MAAQLTPAEMAINASIAATIATRVAAAPAGSVTAEGFYIPNVDIASYSDSVARPNPSVPTRTAWTPRPEVVLYGRPTGMAGDVAAVVAACLLLDAGQDATTSDGQVSSVLSAFELLFPGFCRRVGLEGVVCQGRVDLPLALRELATNFDTTTGQDLDQAGRDTRLNTAEAGRLGWNTWADRATGVREQEVVAMLSALLFAVYKSPNAVNGVAFSQRRPRAAAQAIGATELPAILRPTEAHYRAFASIISAPNIRVRVMGELVTWILSTEVSTMQSVAVSQVRLARRSGLSGHDLARSAMMAYGAVLRRVRHLTSDIEAFEEHRRAVSMVRTADKEYRHLIYGPLADTLARGDYSNLAMIGRDLRRSTAGTMANFGRDVPEDLRREVHRQAGLLGVTILGLPST